MKSEPKIYGQYKCEVIPSREGNKLVDLRPVRLTDEGKEGKTKTVKIYPHEADIMNHGVGRAPKWNAASRHKVVYLTPSEFEEITGEKDPSFTEAAEVQEKPRKGRPRKEETKTEK